MGLRKTLAIEKVIFIDKKRIRKLTFAYVKRENNRANLAAEKLPLLITATFRTDTSFYGGDNNIIHPTSNILDAVSS